MTQNAEQNKVRLGFVMEQTLGHVTYGENLARSVEDLADVCPIWMRIEPHIPDRWERIPGVRSNWSLKGSLRARDALIQATRTRPLDALFMHTQSIALFALPFMRRIPTLLSLDATPRNFDRVGAAYGHSAATGNWLEQRKFDWHCRVFTAAAELVAWSEWAKNSLVQEYGVPAEKIIVVPPGIDLQLWNGRRASDSAGGPLRLLFVGGDFQRKGGPLLLEAFRNGLAQRCTLDIVTTDRKVELELWGEERIRVHCDLTANDAKLRQLYAQSDIFVLPTLGDCMPMAILEALASGLPVVTTEVGALSEVVHEGRNGLLVPPGDSKALWKALYTLIGDDGRRQGFAQAARQIAVERFDAQRNYGTILARMKALANSR